MGFRNISIVTEPLTRSHVQRIRAAKPMPNGRDRKFKESRASWIEQLVLDGHYHRAEFAICKCKETKTEYRVNGQHQSTTLGRILDDSYHPAEFPDGIPCTWETWECDTLEDLTEVFDMFDNPASARTNDDKFTTYKGQYTTLRNTSQPLCKSACKGINYSYKRQFPDTYRLVTTRELGTLLAEEDAVEFCLFLSQFENGAWNGYTKPGVCACVYDTWKKYSTDSAIVWELIFEENDNDPQSVTRKYVARMRGMKGSKPKPVEWWYKRAEDCFKAAWKELM